MAGSSINFPWTKTMKFYPCILLFLLLTVAVRAGGAHYSIMCAILARWVMAQIRTRGFSKSVGCLRGNAAAAKCWSPWREIILLAACNWATAPSFELAPDSRDRGQRRRERLSPCSTSAGRAAGIPGPARTHLRGERGSYGHHRHRASVGGNAGHGGPQNPRGSVVLEPISMPMTCIGRDSR